MTDGQVVSLEDGTQAQVKQVKVSDWQTVLVAIELPRPVSLSPAGERVGVRG